MKVLLATGFSMLCTASAGNSKFSDAAELHDEALLLQKGLTATRKARALDPQSPCDDVIHGTSASGCCRMSGQFIYDDKGCCGSLKEAEAKLTASGVMPVAVVLGTSAGECCRMSAGMSDTAPLALFSASKWISAIMVLQLVERGDLTLDTKVSEVLDWWTAASHDDVTVKKLLTQTDGMTNYPGGLGACESHTTLDCAKEAYEVAWPAGEGQSWTYSETSFYVIGAIVMKKTDTTTYDQAFQKLLAPNGVPKIPSFNFKKCSWAYPTVAKADPGGGIVCSAAQFAKMLESLAAGNLISEASWQAMKNINADLPSDSYANFGIPSAPDSMFAMPPPPGSVFKYGLGHFQQTDSSTGEPIVLSSLGAAGTLPWMFTSNRSWGVAVRWNSATPEEESWKHSYRLLVANDKAAWWHQQ